MNDLISRQAAIDAIKAWGLIDGLSEGQAIEILADEEKLPSAEPKTRCIAQIKIDRDDMEDLVNEKVNEIVDKMLEQKTDGVFVKGGLTISGEPPMPEGCMDCKLQDRCLCIPPDLSADEISELYISRRPNCQLSMVAEPKTGEWVKVIDEETPNVTKWHYECDQCGAGRWEKGQRYCQNCGARMRGEEEHGSCE